MVDRERKRALEPHVETLVQIARRYYLAKVNLAEADEIRKIERMLHAHCMLVGSLARK